MVPFRDLYMYISTGPCIKVEVKVSFWNVPLSLCRAVTPISPAGFVVAWVDSSRVVDPGTFSPLILSLFSSNIRPNVIHHEFLDPPVSPFPPEPFLKPLSRRQRDAQKSGLLPQGAPITPPR